MRTTTAPAGTRRMSSARGLGDARVVAVLVDQPAPGAHAAGGRRVHDGEVGGVLDQAGRREVHGGQVLDLARRIAGLAAEVDLHPAGVRDLIVPGFAGVGAAKRQVVVAGVGDGERRPVLFRRCNRHG